MILLKYFDASNICSYGVYGLKYTKLEATSYIFDSKQNKTYEIFKADLTYTT